jgi:hypothetical protein
MTEPSLKLPPRPLPVRHNVSIRVAVTSDLPFIDSLQKQHAKQVGWMPTAQLEGKIRLGHVIVAEEVAGCELLVASSDSQPATSNKQLATPVGYCIGTDQYFKRDDVGIIYQMNVVPGRRRSLVGATLVKAMFDRAAYGCRLFCCWCAQDIEANHFWEALGFVPLAFRAGSREKGRVHIFWQRRIRAGDTTTPYWFPSQTTSGSIREDRLVFPIPPGVHWREAMPIVLPEVPRPSPAPIAARPRKGAGAMPAKQKPAPTLGRLQFARPAEPKPAPPRREPRQKVKNDPRLVAAARELRDRWLEQVNAGAIVPQVQGRYDVGRAIEGKAIPMPASLIQTRPAPALPAAA